MMIHALCKYMMHVQICCTIVAGAVMVPDPVSAQQDAASGWRYLEGAGERIAVTARYQGGDSLATIAARVGFSKEGVRRVLLRRGVALRGRGWAKGRHSRHANRRAHS